MRYLKTYEFFGIKKNYYSIDHLFTDVDETKIQIEVIDAKSYRNEMIIYEKDSIQYKIKVTSSVSPEFGPEDRIYFFVNNEFKKVKRKDLIALYYSLKRAYKNYIDDIKKYNL